MSEFRGKAAAPYLKVTAMQSRNTVHIMASEWRWVILIGSGLVLLAFAPLIWVALRGTPDWQFMGALHNYQDGASYLSKMLLGREGHWLIYFLHTPEAHSGAFIQVIYLVLGHLARATAVPPIVMFHVARAGAALFMYVALYQLGATVWVRLRSRRIFFAIASLGSGFGWLLGTLTGNPTYPDFTVPEAYAFYSTLMNVHFPLTLACLSMLASLLIAAFRPGAHEDPEVNQSWPIAGLLSVLVAFLYPQALVPIGAAAAAFVFTVAVQERRIPFRMVRWVLALIFPAVPIAFYYYFVVTYNPALAEWNAQNFTPAPTPLVFLGGFGLPLLLALPGIIRAVRRFERDGDRLMLLWLAAMLFFTFLPTNIQRRFAVGFIIPVAYFATRAIEDVWLTRIHRRWRGYVFALLLPLMAVSQILMLFLPVLPAVSGNPAGAIGVFLPTDYVAAYQWLAPRTSIRDVVLASPVASRWLPGWSGARVVYGHDYETLYAGTKLQQVTDWYAHGTNCAELLAEYEVRYVLNGPEEAKLGQSPCLEMLQPIVQVGRITIYAP